MLLSNDRANAFMRYESVGSCDGFFEKRVTARERTELLWHGGARSCRRQLPKACALPACEHKCPSVIRDVRCSKLFALRVGRVRVNSRGAMAASDQAGGFHSLSVSDAK